MTDPRYLKQAAYARLRGVAKSHVTKLKQTGRLAFHETYTAGEVFDAIRSHLEAGDHAAVGAQIAAMLRALAKKEAATEAAIQIDKEWNEASGAALDAYDDRMDDL